MTDDRDALCWACDGTDIAYVDAIGMRWCRKCYEDDQFDGEAYEGTSALGAMRYLKLIGRIREYRWCYGVDDVRLALSYNGPVGIGVKWKSGMWNPDVDGFITPTGDDVGGHEVCLIGNNEEEGWFEGINSWGIKWGMKGRFRIRHGAAGELLADGGDAVQVTG